MEYEEYRNDASEIKRVINGWIQNLARNAAGEGWTLDPETVAEALSELAQEYDTLANGDVDDVEDWLERWAEDGRGTE